MSHAPPAGGTRLWHAMTIGDACQTLQTSTTTGLTSAEARHRLDRCGPNRLPEAPAPSWIRRFAAQFTQMLIGLLAVAAIVSFVIGDRLDALAIAAIVVVNAILGFVQEFRAERALASLQSLATPRARVLRDGAEAEMRSEDVVPGDVLLLAAGDAVAADGRLVEAASLRVDEALLTGESVAVEKDIAVAPTNAELADRRSMVYQGTLVVAGRARVMAVATGSDTEMGRIAASVATQRRPPTPLQLRLERLARALVAAALVLSAAVLFISLLRGLGFREGFFTAVSLSVAVVPEGLPAATTIVLALAVQRMAARNALVRRLAAVETLGSVTVICADKTGTLTQNSMRVESLWLDHYARPALDARAASKDLTARLLTIGLLCNDAATSADGASSGDPTETALLDLAEGLMPALRPSLVNARRIGERPFDTARRLMTVEVETAGGRRTFTKGAPEAVMLRCVAVATGEGEIPLDDPGRAVILSDAEAMARGGLRVLALADGSAASWPAEREENLTLVGMVGLADPLRPEAAPAIHRAMDAGVRVAMITGDHAVTAQAIARQAGLDASSVVTGKDISERTGVELADMVRDCSVFARVTSEHKLDIVEALRARGEVVAMTGDGVNDAPALRAADIGIAMGVGGTDVARDASDLVLADNNFYTIVAAIEEGRTVFENLRSLIHFLVTCNLAEVVVVFTLLATVGETPLLPLQILFVNLLTDGLPALALGVERGEPEFMRARPGRSTAIFARDSIPALLGISAMVALVTFAAYAWGQVTGGEHLASRMTFATLVGSQLSASLAFRSELRSVFQLPRNLWLLLAIACSALALFLVFYAPALQEAFDTAPLSPREWVVVSALSSLPFVAVEAIKLSGLARRLPGVPG